MTPFVKVLLGHVMWLIITSKRYFFVLLQVPCYQSQKFCETNKWAVVTGILSHKTPILAKLQLCGCTNTKKLSNMLLSLLKRPFSVDDLRHCSLLYSRHFAFFSRTGCYAQAFLRGISKMFWPKNLWNIHLKTGWTIGVHFFFVSITDVNLVPWV